MPEMNFDPIDENAILKEIWATDGIRARTELSEEQVHNINKLTTLSNIFGSTLLNNQLNDFMELKISLNRKSRSEFVDLGKAHREDQKEKGGMGRWMMG